MHAAGTGPESKTKIRSLSIENPIEISIEQVLICSSLLFH